MGGEDAPPRRPTCTAQVAASGRRQDLSRSHRIWHLSGEGMARGTSTFDDIFLVYGGQFRDALSSRDEVLSHMPISTSSSSSQPGPRPPGSGASPPHQPSCIGLGPARGCDTEKCA